MNRFVPTKTLVCALGIVLIIAFSYYQALPGAASRYRAKSNNVAISPLLASPGEVTLLKGLPDDAQSLCAFDSAGFAAFFDSGVITKNGFVKPANSLNFGGILDPNCRFYS